MQDWQTQLTATGTLRASAAPTCAAEVSGIVDELHFHSGDDVAAGDRAAAAAANDDDAKLQQLQAVADLAEITYERDLKQLRAQGVAQATVDTDAGNLRSARAQVAAQQALMAEKFVRAPFAGRLGIRQVDLGQYLSRRHHDRHLAGARPDLRRFLPAAAGAGEVQGRPGRDGERRHLSRPNFPGTVLAINAKVDPASRMVQVRATLRNTDHALLPGMFVTVSVAAGAPQQR